MVKWKISEEIAVSQDRSELFVFSPLTKRECINKDDIKVLIDTDDLKFSLVYHNAKMIGYHFDYNNPTPEHHVITNRMVTWFFDGIKEDPQINVLFEDQNIRLLSYNNSSDKVDYWLVGRWRGDVE